MNFVKGLKLSIIILSYKSKAHLEVLLPSIWASQGIDLNTIEVIVVDNDSKDGSLEWLSDYAKASPSVETSEDRSADR